MAVEVYDLPVAAGVRPALAPWLLVMALEFLPVEEFHATDRTAPVLLLGQPHVTVGQRPEVDLPSCPPVAPQTGGIRGGPTAHQLVPDDLEPPELQQVGPAGFIAEHPAVLPL